MNHPTGWLPDPPPTAELLGAGSGYVRELLGASLGDEGGLERAPWILSQEGESCTGHFGAQAIYGLTGEQASPYLPWFFARVHDHRTEDVPDTGCSVAAFTRALQEHGACSYEHWHPLHPDFALTGKLAKPPGLARVEAQKRNLDLLPLYGSGSEVVHGVCAALDRGQPVGIVVGVNEQFRNAGVAIGPRERGVRANHIVTGWRYRVRGDGSREVLVVNSWGYGWGSSGCTWLHESWIAAAEFLCAARGVS